MNFSVSLTGAKEIDQVLLNLPKELSHQVLGAAHYAAAKPLVERDKLLAPEGPTGNLVDSQGAVKVSAKRAQLVGEVLVGPRGRKARHAAIVSFGTRQRRNRRGANRGVMPKNPYLQKAFEREKGNVEKLIGVSVGRVMLRTMKRYIR